MTSTYDPSALPRDFKGIWIPREIWLHKELSPLEKMVWAEVHSLYDRTKGGCYAKNDYLAKFFGVGETYISKVISKLKSFGYIQEVHFNGRQRVIRAVLPPEDLGECKADLHYSARQTCTEEQGRLRQKCNPPIYIENKEENKKDTPLPPKGEAAKAAGMADNVCYVSKRKKAAPKDPDLPPKKKFRPHVELTDAQMIKLVSTHGEDVVAWMLDILEAYKASNGKAYTSDYHTMVKGGWVHTRMLEEKAKRGTLKSTTGNHRANSKLRADFEGKQTYVYEDLEVPDGWEPPK